MSVLQFPLRFHGVLWENRTSTVYYGIAFALYVIGVWLPTLTGIALLFGIGNAFDSFVSLIAYRHLLKKNGIDLLDVT